MEKVNYLIIGGGIAGSHAAEKIREKDQSGSIVVVNDEPYLPYDRVPLSKNYLLGKIKQDVLYIKKADFYKEKKIQVLTGRKAVSLDTQKRSVRLDDNSEILFEKLLLATGGQARHLSIPGSDLKGVHYLRTMDDAEDIMKAMQEHKKAVVIGGGFIGCELASTFSKKNINTTIIEVASKILGRVFDESTAVWLEKYLENKGVKILTKTVPKQIIGRDGKVVTVEIESGEQIPADFVVIGIGISPNTELAKNAGLKVDNGIVVDEHLETSVPGIYAASDVANFYSHIFGKHLRLEHYDLAIRHGMLAGENMAGGSQVFNELPYFFSFMFDIRIEVYGDMSKYDKVIVRGTPTKNGNITKFYLDDGIVNAVMMITRKEDVESIKRLIRSRKKITPESLANESQKVEVVIP